MTNSIATHTAIKTNQTKDAGISWEKFQRKYLTRENGYKYEWLDGVVEKTKRMVDYTQFYIIQNLQEFFYQLKAQGLVDGALITEGDVFF